MATPRRESPIVLCNTCSEMRRRYGGRLGGAQCLAQEDAGVQTAVLWLPPP